MATVSALPANQEGIKLVPSGQEITRGLTVLYLPDGSYNFFVHGSDRYVLLFSDPKVFGTLITTLSKGNNLFSRQNNRRAECYIFSEAVVINSLRGQRVQTGPIIIPPRPGPPPKRTQRLQVAR